MKNKLSKRNGKPAFWVAVVRRRFSLLTPDEKFELKAKIIVIVLSFIYGVIAGNIHKFL